MTEMAPAQTETEREKNETSAQRRGSQKFLHPPSWRNICSNAGRPFDAGAKMRGTSASEHTARR